MRNAVLLLAYFGKVAALSGGLCDHDLRSNRPDAPDVCLHRSCASCADAESCCRKHFNSRCCLRRIRRLGSTCRHPKDVDCMLPPLFTSAPPTALCGSGIRDALNATCCAASCGDCRRVGCARRPGGRHKCCPRFIETSGEACQHPAHDGCLLGWHASSCVSNAHDYVGHDDSDNFRHGPRSTRKKAALMAYTFGNNPRSCNPFFVRSFAAMNSQMTDLVVLHEGPIIPCGGERSDVVRYERVPVDTVTRMLGTGLNPAAYRLIVFMEWLTSPNATMYAMAGVLDTDLIFQWDIFDAIQPLLQSPLDVHLVSENPKALNGGCGSTSISNFTVSRLQRSSCAYAQRMQSREERAFWDAFACSWPLNLGTMFGARLGMVRLLKQTSDALMTSGKGCWDQGVLNVLVYNGTLANLVIWDYFEGLVKTMDIGAVQICLVDS